MEQAVQALPRHVAIIMDGNGRWAKKRYLPRLAGHKAGIDATRKIVEIAAQRKIEVLSLFTFSSENWQRPADEVDNILGLFLHALQYDVKKLHQNNVRLKVIGDIAAFSEKLQTSISNAETLTAANTGLTLVIAANYGGQWDIVHAAQQLLTEALTQQLTPKDITAESLAKHLMIPDLPAPDLFIRTSGEQRISNFFLWQLAYTELYFPTVFWPDFNEEEFDKALSYFASRKRRFGLTDEQMGRIDA